MDEAVRQKDDWILSYSRLNSIFEKSLPDIVIRSMAENLSSIVYHWIIFNALEINMSVIDDQFLMYLEC